MVDYAIMLMNLCIILSIVYLWMEYHLKIRMINFIVFLILMNLKILKFQTNLMSQSLVWHVMELMLLLRILQFLLIYMLEIGYACKEWEATQLDLNQHSMEWNQLLEFINGVANLNSKINHHLK